MTAQNCVCVCVSESCGDVAEKLGVIFQIYYITHCIFFAVFSFYLESSRPLMTLLQMLVFYAAQLAHICCSSALARSGCGLRVGIDSKKSRLMEDRPDSAPPASSTATTLFTPHKQAGRPPRFEAALRYCRKLRGSS